MSRVRVVPLSEADINDLVCLLRKDVEHRKRRSRRFKEATEGRRGDANAKVVRKRAALADRLERYLDE